ncbi:hypothetical protein J6S55_02775 [Candidatus Saccharibacteria bacterium]|nr:hypothetical protein [Candidatus Saccharibacteria bacterium]
MKDHEHYSGSEEINTLRDSEELIKFGEESLPRYTLEYWNDACKTMEPKRINGLADALAAIKDGDSDEAVKMLKRDWLEDGLVLGSVATYLPEGVDVVRQIHMDVYGEDRSKENSAFLDQMEKWHDEQKKKLAREVGGAAIAKNTESYHGPTTREKFMERVHDTFGPEEARMLAYKMRSKEEPDPDSALAREQYDAYRASVSFLGETDEPKYVPGIVEWTEKTYKQDLLTYRRNFARWISEHKITDKEQIDNIERSIDNIDNYLANPTIKPSYRETDFPKALIVQGSATSFENNRGAMYCYDLDTACHDVKEVYGKITARLYMCPRTDNMIELIDEFKDKCDNKGIRYEFKYNSDPRRNDRFIVYTNYDKINDHIDVLKEIKKERPELFEDMDDTRKNPFWGKIDGAPEGVYFGEEPPELVTIDEDGHEKKRRPFTSYSQVRADAFILADKQWGVEVYGEDKDNIGALFITPSSKHFGSPSDISWKDAEHLEQIFREKLRKDGVDPENLCFNKPNTDIYIADEDQEDWTDIQRAVIEKGNAERNN